MIRRQKNRDNGGGSMRRMLLALLGSAFILTTSLAPAQAAGTERPDRMLRQIGVMEKILDKLLLDSPNFLIRGGDVAHGLYLPEFGTLFTFEASLNLTDKSFSKYLLQNLENQVEIKTNDQGEQVIVIKPQDKESDKDDSKPDLESRIDLGDRLYKKGKEELTQVLLDYGETMSELKNGQWIAIAAFLDRTSYFKEDAVSRLLLKIKIDDLRAYSANKLSEEDVRSRFVVQEF